MTPAGYHYADVPQICEALEAEGLSLSIDRVRTRRGNLGGSNSYISEDIKRWKAAQGDAPDAGADHHGLASGDIGAPSLSWRGEDGEDGEMCAIADRLPEPDPARVEFHLQNLQGEADLLALMSHLQEVGAAYQACLSHVDQAVNWLHRRGEPLTPSDEYARILGDLRSWGAFQRVGASIAAAAEDMRKELMSQYRLVKKGG